MSSNSKATFIALTKELAEGLLREAVGYRIVAEIPYYQGIVGYMVEAPLLWIRHSRFPILFIAYDRQQPGVLNAVVKQLEMARATEYFALLIVVPAHDGSSNEAEELRHIVSNSVYGHDFVVLDYYHLASLIAHNSSKRLIEIILEQGIDLATLSPYVLRGPVAEQMFFGREQEIKTIAQALQKGNYAIVGGRRIGKSSLLLKLARLLNNDPRYRAVYVNCEDKFSYADLLQVLGDEFDVTVTGDDPLQFRKIAAALNKAGGKQQSVVLFDEVDELLAYDAAQTPVGKLFKTFRALSHEELCRFVFSGSRTLFQHLHDPQSPFFNFCEELTLRQLDAQSVAEIVRMPMQQLGVHLPDEEALLAQVADLSSGHPNLVQWLCDQLLKTITARRITRDDLRRVAETPEFRHHFIETAWGEATRLERLITLVMAGPFTLDELHTTLAHYGISDRIAIRDALEVLRLYALLERRDGRYSFALRQFPHIARATEDIDAQIERLVAQGD